MTRIAPVNLAYNPKTLWFDARDLEISPHDFVVVLTARGVELGHMAGPVFEASREDLTCLKSELRSVKRIATDEDIAQGERMEQLSCEALPVFREIVAESGDQMRPISVEYLLEGDKAIFYFEAEDRVDFRDLVRTLASRFHVRVDMRQIGVRDEARMIGGYGHCGQQLCCSRMGGEFCPVSIRMAKEQDLSLNPQKISGVCGRLMCCLRYEYDAYKEFKSRAPKQNALIETPDGSAKVASLDVPREVVTLRLEEDHKMVKVPLADMETAEGAARPNQVGQEAWDRALAPEPTEAMAANYMTSNLTGTDMLGDGKAVRRNNANVKNATGSTPLSSSKTETSRRKRRRKDQAETVEAPPVAETTHRQRRRRSTKLGSDGSQVQVDVSGDSAQTQPVADRGAGQQGSAGDNQERNQNQGQGTSRSRRRRRGRGGNADSNNGNNATKAEGSQGKAKADGAKDKSKGNNASKDKKDRPRPGQKSSGLRQAQAVSEQSEGGEGSSGSNSCRRRRRSRRSNNQEKGASDES